MKEAEYSVHQKMVTLLLSIVIGCRYKSDINDMLVPDTVAAKIYANSHNALGKHSEVSFVNQIVKAKIQWIPPENGGRQNPSAGPRYSTVARFEDIKDKWPNEAWSIVAEFLHEKALDKIL